MDRPRIVRLPRPPINEQPDIHQLRHELAAHLLKYPVSTWPPSVLAAVNGVLSGYGLWRESLVEDGEVTRPLIQLLR